MNFQANKLHPPPQAQNWSHFCSSRCILSKIQPIQSFGLLLLSLPYLHWSFRPPACHSEALDADPGPVCSIKMELCTQILALLIMEKLWSQILVLCSMKKELCTQILALPIMEKLWSQILVLYSRRSLDMVGLVVEVARSLQESKRS